MFSIAIRRSLRLERMRDAAAYKRGSIQGNQNWSFGIWPIPIMLNPQTRNGRETPIRERIEMESDVEEWRPIGD
jgi:hypothetical protein